MNLPNKLTIFRIILVPIMVIIPFLGIPGDIFGIPIQNLIIIAIFGIASYTDHLEKTQREHYELTKEQWQTRIEGQMCSTGEKLNVTPYEELRSFIKLPI